NVLRTARIMAHDQGAIELHHLADDFLEEIAHAAAVEPPPVQAPMAEVLPVERTRMTDVHASAITQALKQCNGNDSTAARAIHVSRNTIYRHTAASARKDAIDRS